MKYSFQKLIIFVLFTLIVFLSAKSQDYWNKDVVKTSDGFIIDKKFVLIEDCMESYKATASNTGIKKMCECQVDLLNRRFTKKQLDTYHSCKVVANR